MYELLANLLIVLVAVLGLMRAIEWIIRSPQALKKSSEIYVQLSAYIDVQTLGWLLLIASSILLLSVFTREIPSYVLLVLGGLGLGTIFCFYGLASAESALFIATYLKNKDEEIMENLFS